MGKKKSVALIVIMVIVLAGLAFISVASFALPSPNYFTPLLSHIQLSTDLGRRLLHRVLSGRGDLAGRI